MPDRPDWLDNRPPRLHDRQNGFDLRLVRDLAAVGVRTNTLSPITKLKPLPQAIPVFLDWLEHLDTKLPGPEHRGRRGTPEHHKAVIRAGLIRNLNDRSAKGNQRVINVLAAQLRTTPPLPDETRFWAARALTTVCTRDDYDLITALIAEQPPGDTVIAGLLSYLGKMRTTEARTIILQHFDHPLTRNYAINALADMKATGVRPLIEPLLDDPDRFTRQTAARATQTPHRLMTHSRGGGLAVMAWVAAAGSADAQPVSVLAIADSFEEVLNNLRDRLVGILALIATVCLTIGGARYLIASGDPSEVEKAKTALRGACLGYALAMLAPVVVEVLKSIVGA
ncbi:hypothetical protein [Nocardia farcinica]|nr:hypothetical protein [Nocardia farcinica]